MYGFIVSNRSVIYLCTKQFKHILCSCHRYFFLHLKIGHLLLGENHLILVYVLL